MGKVVIFQIPVYMKANLKMANLMVGVLSPMWITGNIRENGKTELFRAEGFLYGLMEINMMGSMLMGLNMEEECSTLIMARYLRELGIRVKNMDMANYKFRIRLLRDSGIMVILKELINDYIYLIKHLLYKSKRKFFIFNQIQLITL